MAKKLDAPNTPRQNIQNDKISHFIHELRTPLGAISTLSNLLLQSTTSKFSQEDIKTIQTIIQSVDMAMMVIDPRSSIMNLHTLVSEVLGIVTVEAKQRGVSILVKRTDLESMRNVTVQSIVKHSITNLLRNGIKFSSGKVYMIFDGKRISIYDNGPGIQPSDRSKLFTYGERLGTSVEGSGIGLALCKQFMQKIGGDLVLRDGHDTIFDIHIPQ